MSAQTADVHHGNHRGDRLRVPPDLRLPGKDRHPRLCPARVRLHALQFRSVLLLPDYDDLHPQYGGI